LNPPDLPGTMMLAMADEEPSETPPSPAPEAEPEEPNRGYDTGISDFVRRAVSAGIEAAARGKNDIVRVATTEVRSWLDRLDLDTEIVKAMSRMVLEVKAEIRFRPADGKLTPEATGDVKIKSAPKS
jgi:hypothetical protein